jgi:hypothetical protein
MDGRMTVNYSLEELFSKGKTKVTIFYKGDTDFGTIKRVVQKVCDNMQQEDDTVTIRPNLDSIQIRNIAVSETEIRFVCELFS